jgi:glycosyltransferase involved in cell wall biosynthesis
VTAGNERSSDAPLRLTYLHGRYPVLTETFIDREVQGLLERGVDLEIVSIRQPDQVLSPAQQTLRERVTYLLPVRWPSLVAALGWALIRRPFTLFRTLAWLLSRKHPAGTRHRTLFHFVTGVYAAWVLRARRGVPIHAHFVDRAATVALVASRLLDTTYSVTAHAREIYVDAFLLRERIGRAAFAVTCTEYNRTYLEEKLGRRATERLQRMYHGLDLEAYGGSQAGTVRDEPPLVLSVAQLWERKGLRYLVEACAILRDRGVSFRCAIVGEGPLRDELQSLIKARALVDCVELVGALRHPEVIALYHRATAFVLPCVVTEDGDRDGIPNVILEAMASSLPVISTGVSGIPEVIRAGETGWSVPERDPSAIAAALEQVIRDPDEALARAERARRLVAEEFDLNRNVDRLLDRFRWVAGGRG